jgi:hypothetical protein
MHQEDFNASDEQLKLNCHNLKVGLPGNQLESSKARRNTHGENLKFYERELLSVSKAFVIDVFQMQFSDTDFQNYMDYVKINVTNDSNDTQGRIEIFTTNDFTNIIQQDSFIGRMNRFITDERHKWLNYWNSVLMDRKGTVLQASMNNIKFEVATTLPMFGMIGDTGIENRIFSIAKGYVFCYKKLLL